MTDARRGTPWLWVRVALATFVLAWILGPSELRDAVPILLVFAVALALEAHFLVSALRGDRRPTPNRLPQEVDRERYGYPDEDEELAEHEDDHRDEDWYEPTPWPGSPLRRFAVGVGLIALLGGVIWFVESRTGWSSLAGETRVAAVERFSEEASRIAEKPVSIRCDEARDYVGAVQHADGVAQVGGELAILTPEICHDLYRLAFEQEATGSRTGRALAVLAHEAWHLRGERDEGRTECFGLQSGVGLGVRLGLSEDAARRLMRQQLTENALRGATTLEYRVGRECRNGGGLDLRPDDPAFP